MSRRICEIKLEPHFVIFQEEWLIFNLYRRAGYEG